jgi:hypothetical protein
VDDLGESFDDKFNPESIKRRKKRIEELKNEKLQQIDTKK